MLCERFTQNDSFIGKNRDLVPALMEFFERVDLFEENLGVDYIVSGPCSAVVASSITVLLYSELVIEQTEVVVSI